MNVLSGIKKSCFLIFLYLACQFPVGAQNQPLHYSPFIIDTISPDISLFVDEVSFKERDSIAETNKKIKEAILKQFEMRKDFVKSFISDGDLFIKTAFDTLTNKVSNEIIAANPHFKGRIKVLTARSLIPNAYNLGNGIIVVNLGLLYKLQSEDQLALIICHEMAHDYLLHVNKSIYTSSSKMYDKSLKRQIKQIFREKYNINKKLEELLIPGILEDMKYSRMDELIADSLGLIFFSKTNYHPETGISVLDVLDNLDKEENDQVNIDLQQFFSLPQVPARPAWFAYEGAASLTMISDEEENNNELADSLKTHPDCKLRKERLLSQMNALGLQKGSVSNSSGSFLIKNRKQADFEVAQALFDQRKISACIYFILSKHQLYSDDQFLKSLLSICFSFYAELQKQRNTANYIGYLNTEYKEEYNRLISFLNELNPKESSGISYWLIRPEIPQLKKSEPYLTALLLSSYAMEKDSEYKELFKEYLAAYPEGRMSKFIYNLNRYK